MAEITVAVFFFEQAENFRFDLLRQGVFGFAPSIAVYQPLLSFLGIF
jgi:hypothetical protein